MLNGPRKQHSPAEKSDVVLRKNYKLFQLGSSLWIARGHAAAHKDKLVFLLVN